MNRLMMLAATLGLACAVLVGGEAAGARVAHDDPAEPQSKAAPPPRQVTGSRATQRRADREQEQAAEARLAVMESLLTGMVGDMRRAQERGETITLESMLTAASARLWTELRERPRGVAGPSHVTLAWRLDSAGLYELAESHLRAAVTAFNATGDRVALRNAERSLASALQGSGRDEEALEIYRARYEAARSSSDRRSEVSNMIWSLETLGRFDEAAALYPEIIQPPDPNAALSMSRAGSPYGTRARHGRALLESGNLAEAEEVFRGAVYAAMETDHQESSAVLAMNAALALVISLQGREEEHEQMRSRIISGARFFAAIGRIENWEWIGRYLAHVGEYEMAAWYLGNGTARVRDARRHRAEHRANLALLEEVRAALAKSADPVQPLSSRRGD